MIYAAVFLGCFVFGVLLAKLLNLGTCGVEYGKLVRCRALVGRHGHDRHVWEVIPGAPLRLYDYDPFYERNRVAVMMEERIAMSVMNPKAIVVGNLLP